MGKKAAESDFKKKRQRATQSPKKGGDGLLATTSTCPRERP